MSVGKVATSKPDAVEMTGISKAFGGVIALNNVDLRVGRGEIHALLGENGAGKSTILKILRGVLVPDKGTIAIEGRVLEEISPEAATRAGIAMIFQEMSLIPTLTVAQNIFLTQEPRGAFGLLDDRAAERQAQQLFEELSVGVDPQAVVGDLSAGQRQLTEIVKATSKNPPVLILDEPTSALTATEVEQLFALLRRLRNEGVAIVYVSHRMDEIFQIADRATILRDGENVTSGSLDDFTLESMIEHIVGRRSQNLSEIPPGSHGVGDAVLELRSVSGRYKPRDVSLTLHRGEVLGVAGLLGSGRSALARLLFGIEPMTSGEILVNGEVAEIGSAQDAIGLGMALIPEDRLNQGVIAQHSVKHNVTLSVLRDVSRRGWLDNKLMSKSSASQISKLNIKTASGEALVSTLSGGNQQKVVLGKWLAAEPDILILDEPTSGIDIGSKADIILLVRELAEQGKSILLISSELSELLAACDRIILLASGRVAGEVSREALVEPGKNLGAAENFRKAEQQLQVLLQRSIGNA